MAFLKEANHQGLRSEAEVHDSHFAVYKTESADPVNIFILVNVRNCAQVEPERVPTCGGYFFVSRLSRVRERDLRGNRLVLTLTAGRKCIK